MATNVGSTSTDLNSNRECVTFVWLDLRRESAGLFVNALRSINDCVRTYTDISVCLDSIQSSHETIFFISSTSNTEFLSTIHQCINVEAMFVLDPNMNTTRGDLPKLFGIFNQQEELLRVLKETFDTFEQTQLERFTFETDQSFLWWQLWKEVITSKKSVPNGKNDLVEQARNYYQGNSKGLRAVDEFDRSYRPNDTLQWCFRSSFPSNHLRHALFSPKIESISPYYFLINDAIRSIQQHSKHSGHGQLFRGMKLSNELVDLFETHTGQLVCANGFFLCSKARNVELQLAALPGYRTDLMSVLFKIDFDASAHFAEVQMENGSMATIFDVATSFRVVCVSRSAMTVIKLKTTSDDGKKFVQEYREKNKGKTVQVLFDELTKPPTPPTPPPPPPPKVEIKKEPERNNSPQIPEEELEANKYLKEGNIDEAIKAYRRIRPMTVRILKIIGKLSVDYKQDYHTGIECYRQAFQMQQKAGASGTDTLVELGVLHYERGHFDLAMKCYTRALSLHESTQPHDVNSMMICLIGIANTHRSRKELNEALDYAQRARALYEKSGTSESESIVAQNLVLLTNIHHELGNNDQALKVGTKALTLSEFTHLSNQSQTVELLNTLGLVEMKLGDLSQARYYFERALKMYSQMKPPRQSEKAEVEKNLQRILEMQQNTGKI
ncbi:unnamed protein product [Adineta steineri]|uniref:Uncharacterized protein n=1 Tax=Adineta steineri TaxID=433720 RepID=A0A813Q0G7_9BILA|nr:unnamed protein product [Adineta steineri]CAF0794262.1 unnamed protein product [Adineta steineri]